MYAVFVTYTEHEGNIVSELIGVGDSISKAKNIIQQNYDMISRLFRKIEVFDDTMTSDNYYTYVGKRKDIPPVGSEFRTCNGFIIEPMKLNELSMSSNI